MKVYDCLAIGGRDDAWVNIIDKAPWTPFITDGEIYNGTWKNKLSSAPTNDFAVLFSVEGYHWTTDENRAKYGPAIKEMRELYPNCYIMVYTGGVERRTDPDLLQRWRDHNETAVSALLGLDGVRGPDAIVAEWYYTHAPNNLVEHQRIVDIAYEEAARLADGERDIVACLQPHGPMTNYYAGMLVHRDIWTNAYVDGLTRHNVDGCVLWDGGCPLDRFHESWDNANWPGETAKLKWGHLEADLNLHTLVRSLSEEEFAEAFGLHRKSWGVFVEPYGGLFQEYCEEVTALAT